MLFGIICFLASAIVSLEELPKKHIVREIVPKLVDKMEQIGDEESGALDVSILLAENTFTFKLLLYNIAFPCLSNSTIVAPDIKKRTKFLASFLVKGNELSLSQISFQLDIEYTNRQFSIPLVTTKTLPRSSLNLEGIIILPFSSIV